MELSEEERNELMKKESSRLLKTGHRVSYSPRKEKALKIYLDGGPAKDLGQDWCTEHTSWFFFNHLAAAAERPDYANSESECQAWQILEYQAALWGWHALTLQFEPQDWLRNPIVHYSVLYCKV